MISIIDDLLKKYFIFYDSFKAFFYSLLIWIMLLRVIPENKLDFHALFNEFYPAYVSLCGFLITAFAVLISINDGDKIEKLKERDQYKQVFDIFYSAMSWLTFLIVLSIFCNFIESNICFGLFVLILGVVLPIIKIGRAVWILKEIFSLYLSSK